MVIKINEYYTQEIDKLKEGWVEDNYDLKIMISFYWSIHWYNIL